MQNLVSEDRKGVVLPIASVGGLAGAYHVPLYIASKHAIVGFVKSMKQAEQYEGVKVRGFESNMQSFSRKAHTILLRS